MDTAQPSGTVTLVFTDIEGSTRLLEELGTGGYREALAEHRRVVRDAFARADGYEVDYEGDAFFYAFGAAPAAVGAVIEAMRALEGGPIRIRVGVHTGSPELDPPKYIGRDVHMAARVMSAGHGGQVLLSKMTRELVEVDATDLGEHRLKDFAEPVSLFQLGDAHFPPLKTISNTNLPRPASSFVGREREVGEVVSLVRGDARLVTLTGPGGTGKTRLAIEAAAELIGEFKAGVFWVGLAALRDPALVLDTVSQALGAKEELGAHIGERELLLLLDNLEQIVETAPELASLVEGCPNLVLLVTSRELLRVRGEVEYEVLPLAEPDAISLFCQRAQVAPREAVEELCRRLDAMPLALELAAARATVLSPEQILERLAQRLDLLKGGRDADPRQQTLRATIEWSYDLLSDEEQRLFARLAVFAGGCTLEAAEDVVDADLDTLQALVEKSLLRRTDGRFWMLETIRDYAAERQAACDDAVAVRRRHADWVVAWGSRLDMRGEDQARSLERLHAELPNIRAALEELNVGERVCDHLELVTNLAQGMHQIGAAIESTRMLENALENGRPCPPEARARALAYASMQSSLTGDVERGAGYAAEAGRLAAGCDDVELRADVLMAASVAELGKGDLEVAERLTIEAIACAEELGDAARVGELRTNLSYIALRAGDLDRARAASEMALPEARRRGDEHLTACLLHNLFLVAAKSGAVGDAPGYLLEVLEICRRHRLEEVLRVAVEGVAVLAASLDAHDVAARLLGVTATSASEVGEVEWQLRLEAERAARCSLGDQAFSELYSAGERLKLEEAAEHAVGWLDRA